MSLLTFQPRNEIRKTAACGIFSSAIVNRQMHLLKCTFVTDGCVHRSNPAFTHRATHCFSFHLADFRNNEHRRHSFDRPDCGTRVNDKLISSQQKSRTSKRVLSDKNNATDMLQCRKPELCVRTNWTDFSLFLLLGWCGLCYIADRNIHRNMPSANSFTCLFNGTDFGQRTTSNSTHSHTPKIHMKHFEAQKLERA